MRIRFGKSLYIYAVDHMPISTGVSDMAVCADPSFVDDDIRATKHLDSALSERIQASRDAYLASGKDDGITSARGTYLEGPVWESPITATLERVAWKSAVTAILWSETGKEMPISFW